MGIVQASEFDRRLLAERGQQFRGRLRSLNSTAAVVFAPKIVARVESSRTFEARIICTLLTKKAMHDNDSATPAATAVKQAQFRVDRMPDGSA